MPTVDTGWVYISSNGQKTYIDVPAGKVLSARVRWKGVQRTVYSETSTTGYASGGGPTSGSDWAFATPPTDPGTLVRVSASVSGSQPDVGYWKAEVWPGGGAYNMAEGNSTGGGVSGTNWSPSQPDTQMAFASTSGPWTWSGSATAYWQTSTTYQTTNPKITANAKEMGFTGTLNHNVESAWYACLADTFLPDTNNEVTHNISSSNRAYVQIQIEYVLGLDPVQLLPESYARMIRADLKFVVRADQDVANLATLFHSRITAAKNTDLLSPEFVWDSSSGQVNWEYSGDGGLIWDPLTSAGAPVDAWMRFTPPAIDMEIGRWYWGLEVYDVDDTLVWSEMSGVRQFRLALSLAARVALEIATADFTAKARAITVSETTNGELGNMRFEIVMPDGDTGLPVDGNSVSLAVRDAYGNEEQFEGWMQGDPERIGPRLFRCFVKLPDSILAERTILVDYASQDVGQTLKDIVDTYCAPLDSSGINVATGFVRPISAFGRAPLDVAKELREQYGLVFWVRSTDSVVFLLKPEDLGVPTVLVVRGQVS